MNSGLRQVNMALIGWATRVIQWHRQLDIIMWIRVKL